MATDITIFRGDDVTFTVNVVDASSNAIDITGSTLFFTVKANETDLDANALITKDVTSHTDPSNGETEVTLSNTDTEIRPGKYVYDFQVVTSGGSVTTYGRGAFIVKQDITLRTS